MALKVIDISYVQGNIDFNALKGNVDGVIIRCGYGDNIPAQDDEWWGRNVSECERLGIPYGVYLFSYAMNREQVRSETEHILRLIKGRKLSYPVYIDLEYAPQRKVFNPEWFIEMGEQIEKAGYWFGVYANLDWFRNTIGSSLDRFTKWVAAYGVNNGKPNTKPNIGEEIWQYTSVGRVDGISGNADMNICYRDFPAEISGKTPTPAPEPKPSADKKDLGNVDVIYQAFTDRWWPKVKNREDWAGKGDGYPIRYLAICVSKGSIKGRVYTEKNGWLPYLTFKDKYDINDLENGVLGDGSPIQAIELYYNTPEGYEYKKVAYCVSGINRETFYPVQHDNETGKGYDGYAGVKGVAVDKFQAWIE